VANLNSSDTRYRYNYFCLAPNGAAIVQTITSPTFITVFVEQTPGATEWGIFYFDFSIGRGFITRFPLTRVPHYLRNYYVAM